MSITENRGKYLDALRFGDESKRTTGDLFYGDKVCAVGLAYSLLGIDSEEGNEAGDVISPVLRGVLGGLPDKVWEMNDTPLTEQVPCTCAFRTSNEPCIHVRVLGPMYTWPEIADWLENWWKEEDGRKEEEE